MPPYPLLPSENYRIRDGIGYRKGHLISNRTIEEPDVIIRDAPKPETYMSNKRTIVHLSPRPLGNRSGLSGPREAGPRRGAVPIVPPAGRARS